MLLRIPRASFDFGITSRFACPQCLMGRDRWYFQASGRVETNIKAYASHFVRFHGPSYDRGPALFLHIRDATAFFENRPMPFSAAANLQ